MEKQIIMTFFFSPAAIKIDKRNSIRDMAFSPMFTASSTNPKDAGKTFQSCRNPESQGLIKRDMPGDAF